MNIEEQLKQLRTEAKLLWKGRRTLLLAMGLIVGSLLFGYYVTYAEYDKISVNQDNLVTAQDELEALEQRKLVWDRALKDPDFATMSALVNDTLLSKKPVLETIYAFRSLTDSSDVKLTRFEFAPGEVATSGARVATGNTATTRRTSAVTQTYLTVNITATGQFDDLLDYLIDAQAMQPIGSVATLKLNKNETGNSSARVTYQNNFYDQQVNASTGTNLPTLTPNDRVNLAAISKYRELATDELGQTSVIGGGKESIFEAAIGRGELVDALVYVD
jgi:hypothetical protein